MSSTLSSLRSSPIPDLAYDSYRSLSLRDQTLLKRQLHHQQENNHHQHQHNNSLTPEPVPSSKNSTYNRNITRAGSVQNGSGHGGKVDQGAEGSLVDPFNPNYCLVDGKTYSLSKFGGESVAFWILLGILAVLAIINALLTFVVFGVLRLGAGMESVEFLPKILKFYGVTDLDNIFKRDGILESLPGNPMEFSTEDGVLNFTVAHGNRPSLVIDQNIINISQVSELKITDRRGREVFSTNTPTLGLPKSLKSLDVRIVKANKVSAGINSTLQMRSHTFVYLKGSEGTHMKGKQVVLAADQDIFLKSVNGKIVLSGSGKDGNSLMLDVNALPLVKEDRVTRKSYTYTTQGKRESQFQLCICMPEGKLFKVAIPVNNQSLPPERRVGCHTTVNACRDI